MAVSGSSLSARYPSAAVRPAASANASGARGIPANQLLAYSGIRVRYAPPSYWYTGSPLDLPRRSHSAMSTPLIAPTAAPADPT